MIEKHLNKIAHGIIHSTDGSPDVEFVHFWGDGFDEDEKIEESCDYDPLVKYIAYCESQIKVARKYLQENYYVA